MQKKPSAEGRDSRASIAQLRPATLAPKAQLQCSEIPGARPLVRRAFGYGRIARAICGDREENRVRRYAPGRCRAGMRVLPSNTVDGGKAVARTPHQPSTINHQRPLKATGWANVALHKHFLHAMNREDVEIAWQANASRNFRIW
jgi:hypothetical protein